MWSQLLSRFFTSRRPSLLSIFIWEANAPLPSRCAITSNGGSRSTDLLIWGLCPRCSGRRLCSRPWSICLAFFHVSCVGARGVADFILFLRTTCVPRTSIPMYDGSFRTFCVCLNPSARIQKNVGNPFYPFATWSATHRSSLSAISTKSGTCGSSGSRACLCMLGVAETLSDEIAVLRVLGRAADKEPNAHIHRLPQTHSILSFLICRILDLSKVLSGDVQVKDSADSDRTKEPNKGRMLDLFDLMNEFVESQDHGQTAEEQDKDPEED
ncbi:hypothetical protein KC367_g156 [Hortaea werneckii]|nr:hypothetical protein KC367_g156 [Hortaea werneckii]